MSYWGWSIVCTHACVCVYICVRACICVHTVCICVYACVHCFNTQIPQSFNWMGDQLSTHIYFLSNRQHQVGCQGNSEVYLPARWLDAHLILILSLLEVGLTPNEGVRRFLFSAVTVHVMCMCARSRCECICVFMCVCACVCVNVHAFVCMCVHRMWECMCVPHA